MRRRVGEKREHLQLFEERARPPVGQHDRQGVGAVAPDVNEVDAQPADLGLIVRQRVQPRFLGVPVEPRAPVLCQLADVVEVGPVVPAGAVDRVRPPGSREPITQVVEDVVFDMDGIGLAIHGRTI